MSLRFLLIFSAIAFFVDQASTEPLRVLTFNLRYATAPDGENAWPLRKETALGVIADFAPHLLGVQEALREQVDIVAERFPHLAPLGVGREADGGGEYSALLYDRGRLDVLSADTFWLSDMPEVRGSNTWGAGCPRVCTWARFVDRATNDVLTVANTHWDHQSQPARLKGAELMAQRLGAITEPLIVMGDFNAGPTNPARLALAKLGIRDSFADLFPAEANAGTFHAFQPQAASDKIDAILVSSVWRVTAAEIVRGQPGQRYASDHYPVTAAVELASADKERGDDK